MSHCVLYLIDSRVSSSADGFLFQTCTSAERAVCFSQWWSGPHRKQVAKQKTDSVRERERERGGETEPKKGHRGFPFPGNAQWGGETQSEAKHQPESQHQKQKKKVKPDANWRIRKTPPSRETSSISPEVWHAGEGWILWLVAQPTSTPVTLGNAVIAVKQVSRHHLLPFLSPTHTHTLLNESITALRPVLIPVIIVNTRFIHLSSLCVPFSGSYLKAECDGSKPSECAECGRGHFLAAQNHMKRCHDCTVCNSGRSHNNIRHSVKLETAFQQTYTKISFRSSVQLSLVDFYTAFYNKK